MAGKAGRRGWGWVRRLPSNRIHASALCECGAEVTGVWELESGVFVEHVPVHEPNCQREKENQR